MTEPPTNVVSPNINSNPPTKKPTAAVTPVVSVTQEKNDANSTVSVNEVAANLPSAAAAAIPHPNQQQQIQQVYAQNNTVYIIYIICVTLGTMICFIYP
jgi:hypothetical protein